MTTTPATRTTPTKGKRTPRMGRLTPLPRLTKLQALDYGKLLTAITRTAGTVPCQSPDNGDQWISEDRAEAIAAAAKCRACPVLEQCNLYATTHTEASGVWGGKTPNQRRRKPKAVAS
ncbi:WhiB family transcriptional regulator [Arthrobacter sp. Br18]|uniref:WhiB family transcriptional regulator n=1 Tax=Arthrobacter sp. Br18 TaxID=1312954 RepID=UPI00056B1993|nr:WhiB family transcriptional regulator [Arthrobacter sp. Br18]